MFFIFVVSIKMREITQIKCGASIWITWIISTKVKRKINWIMNATRMFIVNFVCRFITLISEQQSLFFFTKCRFFFLKLLIVITRVNSFLITHPTYLSPMWYSIVENFVPRQHMPHNCFDFCLINLCMWWWWWFIDMRNASSVHVIHPNHYRKVIAMEN